MTLVARETITAETLFQKYFLPLYPMVARADLVKARATDVNPAKNSNIVRHLDEAAAVFVQSATRLFGAEEAAHLALDYSDASIHRLSQVVTAQKRNLWAQQGDAGSPDNELFNIVVHGAAYTGTCIVRRHGGAWRVRSPLWESLVALSSPAGEAELAVFHWWLKSLADAKDDDVSNKVANRSHSARAHTSLVDRYRTHVEIPRTRVETFPIFVVGERKLPRLSKSRYDIFYKYIKANLPELRDVGEHFPSPERFDELAFKWLDFYVVGGGRRILVVGLTGHGVHLFWLAADGFEKAALYPADAFPEPILRIMGDKLQLVVSHDDKMLTHEMLWWGP
jgi:hypothetical protein